MSSCQAQRGTWRKSARHEVDARTCAAGGGQEGGHQVGPGRSEHWLAGLPGRDLQQRGEQLLGCAGDLMQRIVPVGEVVARRQVGELLG